MKDISYWRFNQFRISYDCGDKYTWGEECALYRRAHLIESTGFPFVKEWRYKSYPFYKCEYFHREEQEFYCIIRNNWDGVKHEY